MDDLAGQFLIASPKLRDPNFTRSVVLMIDHGPQGSLGVVINRISPVSIRDAMEQIKGFEHGPDRPLRIGGPCAGPLIVLHTVHDTADREVVPGVFYSAEQMRIDELLELDNPPALFIAGYSGWGEGQLDSELEEGTWLIAPASRELIFGDVRPLWQKLNLYCTLGRQIPLDKIPDQPGMN